MHPSDKGRQSGRVQETFRDPRVMYGGNHTTSAAPHSRTNRSLPRETNATNSSSSRRVGAARRAQSDSPYRSEYLISASMSPSDSTTYPTRDSGASATRDGPYRSRTRPSAPFRVEPSTEFSYLYFTQGTSRESAQHIHLRRRSNKARSYSPSARRPLTPHKAYMRTTFSSRQKVPTSTTLAIRIPMTSVTLMRCYACANYANDHVELSIFKPVSAKPEARQPRCQKRDNGPRRVMFSSSVWESMQKIKPASTSHRSRPLIVENNEERRKEPPSVSNLRRGDRPRMQSKSPSTRQPVLRQPQQQQQQREKCNVAAALFSQDELVLIDIVMKKDPTLSPDQAWEEIQLFINEIVLPLERYRIGQGFGKPRSRSTSVLMSNSAPDVPSPAPTFETTQSSSSDGLRSATRRRHSSDVSQSTHPDTANNESAW